MSKKLLVSLAAVGVLVSVSAGNAQIPEDPIRWALALPAPNTTTTPGGAITLSLTATIDDGWHLYATTIGPGGPIPTAISVPTGQAFSLSGEINEPPPKSAFDPNFNKVLEFHEDKATFGIPLKVSASSGYGELPARVAVSFQTCNDRFCLPPKQVVPTVQVSVMPSAAQRAAPVPPDRDAFNKALSIKDLPAQLTAITKYAADFPDSDTVYFAVSRAMRNIGDADGADTTRLSSFVRGIESIMDKAAARQYQRADVYYNMALRLVNRGVLIDDAARLAGKSVPLLNNIGRDDFMAKELATHNERQASLASRTPGRAADPFPKAESEERWIGIRANHLSALGRALLLQGHTAEAQARLRESYALVPVMETALALSTLDEKAGKFTEALDLAVAAQLTGKMTAPESAQLDAIYRKTHNGSLDGLEALLDTRYRSTHKNPIVTTRYAPTPARTSRTVLAELFTGAACIPCVSVDLSFEKELERYSRTELAYLVYHIHAPTSDPYGNFAVEARGKYYGVHAAPTVLLDGVVAPVGEGGAPLATDIFGKIDAAIGKRLEAKPAGQITATAARKGPLVSVQMSVSGGPESSQTVRLHAVLVENQASYSGENGLRIQPMVVREMMGQENDRGTLVGKIGSQKIAWDVDLAKLEAANLAYYDWYIADLKKRANIDASFREKKHTINAANLSIVVFLQDDVTHEVLQSVFVPIK